MLSALMRIGMVSGDQGNDHSQFMQSSANTNAYQTCIDPGNRKEDLILESAEAFNGLWCELMYSNECLDAVSRLYNQLCLFQEGISGLTQQAPSHTASRSCSDKLLKGATLDSFLMNYIDNAPDFSISNSVLRSSWVSAAEHSAAQERIVRIHVANNAMCIPVATFKKITTANLRHSSYFDVNVLVTDNFLRSMNFLIVKYFASKTKAWAYSTLLALLEPGTPQDTRRYSGILRISLIFRAYDSGQKGFLDASDYRRLHITLRKMYLKLSKGDTSEFAPKQLSEAKKLLKGCGTEGLGELYYNSCSEAELLNLANQRIVRGLSQLLRLSGRHIDSGDPMGCGTNSYSCSSALECHIAARSRRLQTWCLKAASIGNLASIIWKQPIIMAGAMNSFPAQDVTTKYEYYTIQQPISKILASGDSHLKLVPQSSGATKSAGQEYYRVSASVDFMGENIEHNSAHWNSYGPLPSDGRIITYYRDAANASYRDFNAAEWKATAQAGSIPTLMSLSLSPASSIREAENALENVKDLDITRWKSGLSSEDKRSNLEVSLMAPRATNFSSILSTDTSEESSDKFPRIPNKCVYSPQSPKITEDPYTPSLSPSSLNILEDVMCELFLLFLKKFDDSDLRWLSEIANGNPLYAESHYDQAESLALQKALVILSDENDKHAFIKPGSFILLYFLVKEIYGSRFTSADNLSAVKHHLRSLLQLFRATKRFFLQEPGKYILLSSRYYEKYIEDLGFETFSLLEVLVSMACFKGYGDSGTSIEKIYAGTMRHAQRQTADFHKRSNYDFESDMGKASISYIMIPSCSSKEGNMDFNSLFTKDCWVDRTSKLLREKSEVAESSLVLLDPGVKMYDNYPCALIKFSKRYNTKDANKILGFLEFQRFSGVFPIDEEIYTHLDTCHLWPKKLACDTNNAVPSLGKVDPLFSADNITKFSKSCVASYQGMGRPSTALPRLNLM